MPVPNNAQDEFDSRLAPYACRHDNGLGRRVDEVSAKDRNEFQRDTSRVMHSSAFRRLQYKTQVFSNHIGDLFRTRLTHSLEVAQVTRASARALRLNEDLVETLALAHDLGHAPFGHLGQDALNEAMRERGGFEHNLQALRVVDDLEKAYIDFDGLNLLFESREGILKHCSASNARMLVDRGVKTKDSGLATLATRFLSAAEQPEGAHKSASLEAQLTDLCDAIAYTHADMEDAVTMGILSLDQLADGIPLFKAAYDTIRKGTKAQATPKLAPVFAKVASGLMMKQALGNLIDSSRESIANARVESLADVRSSSAIIRFSPDFLDLHHKPFKRFLRQEVYTHADVERWRMQQHELIMSIFNNLSANPKWLNEFDKEDSREFHRQLCDHLAGMTDRSVMTEFNRVKELGESKSARKALNRKK